MSHELAEKVAGLASRVNNLAVLHVGSESRALLELQDRLAKLELVAIVRALRAEHPEYARAVRALDEAIAFVGDAEEEIDDVARAIRLVAKAAQLAEKAVRAGV